MTLKTKMPTKKQLEAKKEKIRKVLEKAANPTQELHKLYKRKIKEIILDCTGSFLEQMLVEKQPLNLKDFINKFVEDHCIPAEGVE